jgi:hypothetical protein
MLGGMLSGKIIRQDSTRRPSMTVNTDESRPGCHIRIKRKKGSSWGTHPLEPTFAAKAQ